MFTFKSKLYDYNCVKYYNFKIKSKLDKKLKINKTISIRFLDIILNFKFDNWTFYSNIKTIITQR